MGTMWAAVMLLLVQLQRICRACLLSGYVQEVADHNTRAGGVQRQGVRIRCLQLLRHTTGGLASLFLEL